MNDPIVNALTIDVEDAVNQAMRNFFGTEMEPTIRVYDNTMRLLDLLAEYETKATFFILGEVAKTHPKLIKNISAQGHELGIHGYSHKRYYNLTREQVRDEIFEAKGLVEDLSGAEVIGHRAPEFSVTKENLWVFDILLEAGIKYDSSIFPAKFNRYGWTGFIKDIDWFNFDGERSIIEAPLSTMDFLGMKLPVCGGGYLRAFPYTFTNYSFRQVLQSRPVNVYMHPYEIDPPPFQEFYMDAVRKSSIKSKFKLRTYWFNRASVIPKLTRLLRTYKFDTLRNVIESTLMVDL